MQNALKQYGPVLQRWIGAKNRKPMLAHGPLQTGKKTLLRRLLDQLGYDVIEPSPRDNLEEYRDGGLFGKTAYLIDAKTFGTKKLPHVVRAPVIYVTHAPYDIGTKAELARRYEMVELKIAIDASKKWGKSDERDREYSYWQAVDIVNRQPFDAEESLRACEIAGDFLSEIAHRTFPSKLGDAKDLRSLELCARVADTLSTVDLVRRAVPSDCVRMLDTVGVIRRCKITSRDLQLVPAAKPKDCAKLDAVEDPLSNGGISLTRRPVKKAKTAAE